MWECGENSLKQFLACGEENERQFLLPAVRNAPQQKKTPAAKRVAYCVLRICLVSRHIYLLYIVRLKPTNV